jgi:hypothetical protein
MTVDEINRGLFEVVLPNFFPGKPHSWEEVGQSILVWVTGEKAQTVKIFSPAEDSNHLRKWVYPEIERRGLWDELVAELALPWLNDAPDMRWEAFMLTAYPAVLAAAALKVLEAGK